MTSSPHLVLIAIFSFLVFSPLAAKQSAYQRAQALLEDDPREAEALLVHFIRQTGNDKLKRAAAHELFTLRLKQGRLAEAFLQAKSSGFKKRFLSAVEEGLKVSESSAGRLVAALRQECDAGGDAEKIAILLGKNKFPVAAYNFSLTVLERCKVEGSEAILPDFPEEAEKVDARTLSLALLEIRAAISRDDTEEAEALLTEVRKTAANFLEKEPAFALQLDFTEARLFSKKEDFKALGNRCAAIEKKKPARWLRNACRFMTAYAYLKQEKYAEAYARIANLKIVPVETDNRLLRLTAAVAADEEIPEKLEKFMRRRSYPECAEVLRKLAEEILEIKAQNR